MPLFLKQLSDAHVQDLSDVEFEALSDAGFGVASLRLRHLGGSAYRLEWETDLGDESPTFLVYRDGRLVGSTQDQRWEIDVQPGAAPVFAVRESENFDAEPEPPAYPATALVTWYAVAGAAAYRVQQEIPAGADQWVTLATVPDDGRGYFTWESDVLADVTTHRFRVTPLTAGDALGTDAQLAVLMVRHPDPPLVGFAYNGSTPKTVTVSAITSTVGSGTF